VNHATTIQAIPFFNSLLGLLEVRDAERVDMAVEGIGDAGDMPPDAKGMEFRSRGSAPLSRYDLPAMRPR
jgi:hypothetical protein